MDLTSRHRSPPSSMLMGVPFTTAPTMGVLQVTDRSRAVTYYFWIPLIAELNTAGELYLWQGFEIKVIPATHTSMYICYSSSSSFAHLLLEETYTTPATVIPKTPAETPSWASILGRIGAIGDTALPTFGSLVPQ